MVFATGTEVPPFYATLCCFLLNKELLPLCRHVICGFLFMRFSFWFPENLTVFVKIVQFESGLPLCNLNSDVDLNQTLTQGNLKTYVDLSNLNTVVLTCSGIPQTIFFFCTSIPKFVFLNLLGMLSTTEKLLFDHRFSFPYFGFRWLSGVESADQNTSYHLGSNLTRTYPSA